MAMKSLVQEDNMPIEKSNEYIIRFVSQEEETDEEHYQVTVFLYEKADELKNKQIINKGIFQVSAFKEHFKYLTRIQTDRLMIACFKTIIEDIDLTPEKEQNEEYFSKKTMKTVLERNVYPVHYIVLKKELLYKVGNSDHFLN